MGPLFPPEKVINFLLAKGPPNSVCNLLLLQVLGETDGRGDERLLESRLTEVRAVSSPAGSHRRFLCLSLALRCSFSKLADSFGQESERQGPWTQAAV